MEEYGIFNSDALDYSDEEAVEAGFHSKEEAEAAIKERYEPDDDLIVHVLEAADEEEEEEDEDDEDFDDDDDDDEDDEDDIE